MRSYVDVKSCSNQSVLYYAVEESLQEDRGRGGGGTGWREQRDGGKDVEETNGGGADEERLKHGSQIAKQLDTVRINEAQLPRAHLSGSFRESTLNR